MFKVNLLDNTLAKQVCGLALARLSGLPLTVRQEQIADLAQGVITEMSTLSLNDGLPQPNRIALTSLTRPVDIYLKPIELLEMKRIADQIEAKQPDLLRDVLIRFTGL